MQSIQRTQPYLCARCLRASAQRHQPQTAYFSRRYASSDGTPPESTGDVTDKDSKEQGALSRRLAQMSEESLETGGRSARKAVEEAGFSQDLKDELEAKIANASFKSEHANAFAEANLPSNADRATRDIAGAKAWTGSESLEDATLRMLTDAHKPMRGTPKAPSLRAPSKIDTGRPSRKEGPGTKLLNARDRTSAYAWTKDPNMPEEEREKIRKEMKHRFQGGTPISTPRGVPRWPNDVDTPVQQNPQVATGHAATLQRLIQTVRRAIPWHERANSQTTRPRRWRPPVSGHGTARFDDLRNHPFSSAPLAAATDGTSNGTPVPTDTLRSNGQSRNSHHRRDSGGASRPIRASALSPSQRALIGARGSAVPVSPSKAARRASLTQNGGKASLPLDRHVRSTQPDNGYGTSCAPTPQIDVEHGTTRTAELIQRFPEPPVTSDSVPDSTPQPAATMAKAQGWSLFPRSSTPVKVRSLSDLQTWIRGRSTPVTEASCNEVQEHPLRRSASATPNDAPTPLAPSASLDTYTLPRPTFDGQGVIANHSPERTAINQDNDGEDESPDRPAIRGESRARYRYSGTPIYELDAASLRSHDERTEQRELADSQLDGGEATAPGGNSTSVPLLESQPPSRVISSRTATSRYFSAESQVNSRQSNNAISGLVGDAAQQPSQRSAQDWNNGARVNVKPEHSCSERAGCVSQHPFQRVTLQNFRMPDLSVQNGNVGRLSQVQQLPVNSQRSSNRQDENGFPLEPVTITTHGRMCRHGKLLSIREPRRKLLKKNKNFVRPDRIPQPISNLDGGEAAPSPLSAQDIHTSTAQPSSAPQVLSAQIAADQPSYEALVPTSTPQLPLQPSPSQPILHRHYSHTTSPTLQTSPSAPSLARPPTNHTAVTLPGSLSGTTTSAGGAANPSTTALASTVAGANLPENARRATLAPTLHTSGEHTQRSLFRPSSIPLPFLHRAKGTWRTRMNRTKCWRCELHRCHKTGWAKVRKALEWTCLCRFKAYVEDSSDDEVMGEVGRDHHG
ncbi:hypothetical protein KC365_g5810 [Hortaea werneckii]|nr:hypothetical protein KC339_g2990 [Hortaea werneckii]KAI7234855.1 hypothetical protein KC365_g5810 [Hortaea werneckii]